MSAAPRGPAHVADFKLRADAAGIGQCELRPPTSVTGWDGLEEACVPMNVPFDTYPIWKPLPDELTDADVPRNRKELS